MVEQKIVKRLFGTHEESFQNLSRTLLAIKYSNTRTIVTLNYKMVDENKTIFKKAFQAFGASIDRFQYCRSLISINNTHFYGNTRLSC